VRRALVPVSLAAVLAAGVLPVGSADAKFRVIAHSQVKGSQIPRAVLSSIFLGQASRWGDGSAVRPVDQSVQSPVRQSFSLDVLRQGLVAVQVYWQRRITRGQRPPPVKASDEEVVSYVASTPGAIGYVSAETPLPAGVKVIEIAD
jgi:ABC-type phosphate transport system substrate-binding protein